jgi:hypothetical protein
MKGEIERKYPFSLEAYYRAKNLKKKKRGGNLSLLLFHSAWTLNKEKMQCKVIQV